MHTQKVLIVEDNAISRKVVRLTLQGAGYTVIEAESGRSAIDAMLEHKPDLVLQDLMLPDISGSELVRKLRGLPHGANIPILALSGFRSMLGVAERRGMDFTAFLFKPVEPSRLVSIVGEYLVSRRTSPAPATPVGAS